MRKWSTVPISANNGIRGFSQSKYGNRRTEVDGIRFDSRKEANRWHELKLMEKAGEISGLQRQVPFVLIPEQRAGGKVVERACKYIADFVYYLPIPFGGLEMVVEDAKGVKTDTYKIKKKLMLWVHGIQIKEV